MGKSDQTTSTALEPATVLAIAIAMTAPLVPLTRESTPESTSLLIFMLAGFVSAIPADSFQTALVGAIPAAVLPIAVILDNNFGRPSRGNTGLAGGFALIAAGYRVASALFGSACGFAFRESMWRKASKDPAETPDFGERTKFAIIAAGIVVVVFKLLSK